VTAVLLADDHPTVRAEIRADLEELGYRICAEVGDADAALAAALRERPALCLLDVRMPGDGLVAARAIVARVPETRVVMLTVSSDRSDVDAAVEAGAVGYVLKDVETTALASALATVLDGGIVVPR